jgi:hypothetical protein
MDGAALFQKVLDPGERLLWTGQPRLVPLWKAGLQYLAMLAGFGFVLRQLLMDRAEPLPPFLEVELTVLLALCGIPGFFLLRQIRRARSTAYALTDRRLFIAVGPRREKIRTVALSAIAPVGVVRHLKSGKVLFFCARGNESLPNGGQMPVWTFLTSGVTDKWTPVWNVRDPEYVQQLIESARNAATKVAAA